MLRTARTLSPAKTAARAYSLPSCKTKAVNLRKARVTLKGTEKKASFRNIELDAFFIAKAKEINLQNAAEIAGQIICPGKDRNADPLPTTIKTLERLLKIELGKPEFIKCLRAFRFIKKTAGKEMEAKEWYATITSWNSGGIRFYLRHLLRAKFDSFPPEIDGMEQKDDQNERIMEILEELLFIRQTLEKIEEKGPKLFPKVTVPPKIYGELGSIENRLFGL